jgi:isoamylase
LSEPFKILPGRRYPAGVSVEEEGVNFSVYSRHASGAKLLLYHNCYSDEPLQIIELDPKTNRTFFTWHVLVVDLPPDTYYTWCMDGPDDTEQTGFRFDSRRELLDPWARAVCTSGWDRARAVEEPPLAHQSMRGVVVADDEYDWEGDEQLYLPTEQMIIYELHVGGFTRHPSSGVAYPGSFSGIIESIPYLQSLGITHVELMPVMAFDEQDVPSQVDEHGLSNYWGYSTHSFFSPHPGYCVDPDRGTHRREFRDMVKALHKGGIGVILDVVFNHTAEGGEGGPHINFRGFGNETFYHLNSIDKRIYRDYTGCGNTVNANHPFVARFILDCLEYWVREMHVDGFRFDLASALARGEDGAPMHNPPLLWGIELSDSLAATKIIAEAWDAAGLYQVGTFPGYRWTEWNGRYRDSIRRFVRGDPGLVGEVATRIAGSSDLYQGNLRLPINSVNFVTCHDGFTLWDLVSYNHKHNDANREDNRDGSNENFSWNCGVEGPTEDPQIKTLRCRQARNLMGILLVSQGVPMLLAGDEILRSQNGNNNTWCQNNTLGWIDWNLLDRNEVMLNFVRGMIALRKRHPSLMRRRFLTGEVNPASGQPDIQWHGRKLGAAPWNDKRARELAFTLGASTDDPVPLHVMMNMSDKRHYFEIPPLEGKGWYCAVDTGRAPEENIAEPERQQLVNRSNYLLECRSFVVLEGR